MIKKNYMFSQKYFCHAAAAELKQGLFFPEKNLHDIKKIHSMYRKTCLFTKIFLSLGMQT